MESFLSNKSTPTALKKIPYKGLEGKSPPSFTQELEGGDPRALNFETIDNIHFP